MQSMTYGELPNRVTFGKHFRAAVGRDGDFQMHLKGSDARCAEDIYGIEDGNSYYNEDEMWGILNELVRAWLHGSDCAGDLASSILSTLDFEWI